MSSDEQHGKHCGGCRELAVVTAIQEVERLCLDGWAFENVGRRVVAVNDVLAIISRLPQQFRLLTPSAEPTMSSDQLKELERRVGEKWVAAAAARIPADAFDPSGWLDSIDMSEWGASSLPPGTLQFPREQWASYPNKRTVALLLAERLLDDADSLTDEQWLLLCLVMQYGGKTRIS